MGLEGGVGDEVGGCFVEGEDVGVGGYGWGGLENGESEGACVGCEGADGWAGGGRGWGG